MAIAAARSQAMPQRRRYNALSFEAAGDKMHTVALLGVGTMGSGMAKRLVQAGFPLTVWNRNAERAQSLASLGIVVAPTPADAAACADVVISMVSDDEA